MDTMTDNQIDGVDDTVNSPFPPIPATRDIVGKVEVKTYVLMPTTRVGRKRLAQMLGDGWSVVDVEKRFLKATRYTFSRPAMSRKARRAAKRESR